MLSKPDATGEGTGASLDWRLALLGGLLWLATLSAPLVESDLYRYSGAILVAIGLRAHFTSVPRLKPGWMAWLCIGWGAYVAIRFLATCLLVPGWPLGTSEWLYIFPVLFPVLGTALYVFRAQIEPVLAAFFTLALGLLLAVTDYRGILAGEVASPLVHHNQIHGAVACGILVVGAFYWLLHYSTSKDRFPAFAKVAMLVAPPVIALGLLAIYGAKSKGVWLAMLVVLPVMFLSVLLYVRRRTAVIVIVALLAVTSLGILAVENNIRAVAGPTALAATALAEQLAGGGELSENLKKAIASHEVPASMNERLKLWSNASEIIAAHPVFGAGSLWLEHWSRTTYADVGYTLIHNGYLEILIRHGFFGLAVFAVMVFAFVGCVYRAWRLNLVSRSAFLCYCVLLLFFMVTLLSNSNNRLALGESFSLVFAAVAFFCYELLERRPSGERRAGRIEAA